MKVSKWKCQLIWSPLRSSSIHSAAKNTTRHVSTHNTGNKQMRVSHKWGGSPLKLMILGVAIFMETLKSNSTETSSTDHTLQRLITSAGALKLRLPGVERPVESPMDPARRLQIRRNRKTCGEIANKSNWFLP